MADRMTKEQRSACMQAVKSKDTTPEMIVRRWLWAHGYRYRLHEKRLPGTPDIALPRFHTVINVNGCFWHAHPGCRLFREPSTRQDFWRAKFRRNRERDAINREKLTQMGWYTITIWECELSKQHRHDTLIALSECLSEILLRIHTPATESPAIAASPTNPYTKK